MDKENAIKKEIKESWFKNHEATLTRHGNLEVLSWENPKSSIYAVRYVFDGNHTYITGDIGEAMFNLTWRAEVNTFNNMSTHYFMEKMRAFSDDRYDFNCDSTIEELKKWKERYLDDNCDMDDEQLIEINENFDKLFNSVNECSCKEHWVGMVNERHNEFISKIDPDYWEWIYNIGDEVPVRIYGYIVGLQMAAEQLKSKNNELK